MKICIATTKSIKSAEKLMAALVVKGHEVVIRNPWKEEKYGAREGFDLCIALGYSGNFHCARRINGSDATKVCVNKLATLVVLKNNKIPCPEFTYDKVVAASKWRDIVCYKTLVGKQGEGVEFIDTREQPLPEAALYTKEYPHRNEYRVVVALGKVFVCRKVLEDGMWWVKLMDGEYRKIKSVCKKAAKALNMDIVGFDVLAKNNNEFVIVEANSGPLLIDEVVDHIVRSV